MWEIGVLCNHDTLIGTITNTYCGLQPKTYQYQTKVIQEIKKTQEGLQYQPMYGNSMKTRHHKKYHSMFMLGDSQEKLEQNIEMYFVTENLQVLKVDAKTCMNSRRKTQVKCCNIYLFMKCLT